MMRTWAVTIALFLLVPVHAMAQKPFVSKLKLTTGQTVVVKEGDFEALSIGSFSVRLYEAASAPDETTFFISGLIHPRDGVLEKAMLADIDGDQHPEIIVMARSVGTGGYISVYAFAFAKNKLLFRIAVVGLAPDADPIAALLNPGNKHE